MIKSLSIKAKFSIKINAKIATSNLPTTAAGTKFLDLASRIFTAPTASTFSFINSIISTYKFTNFKE